MSDKQMTNSWTDRSVGDCCDILDHRRIPVSTDERARRKGQVPYYGANGQQGTIDGYIFDEDLILVAEDGGDFDNYATKSIAYRIRGKSWVNNHAHVLRVKDGYDQSYIFHSLAHKDIRFFIRGGTRSKLNKGELTQVRLFIPTDINDQITIATILDTIDNTIRHTEAMIEKVQRVKTGLLHDLFTYGLDENGELRDPIRHPEQFKDSKLGRIPKDWVVASLVSRITLPQGQVDPKIAPYRDWILVAPDHVESETGRLIAKQTALEQNAISGKYIFEGGDVVYSKIRPYLRKAVLMQEGGLCSADMYPLHPNTGVNPRFLLAVILGESFSRFASAVSMRSGFPKINRTELAEYMMAWPESEEQERIAPVLIAADNEAMAVEAELRKLLQVKAGLMRDLLTGTVPVTSLIGVANA